MSRDFLIHNGKLTSDLDADGNLIKNLPGVAHLVDGKVPSDELPSYVDDVLEYATRSSFPETGERGKIYIALDTNKQYRWGGTTYVEIAGTPTLDDAVTRTSANGVKSSGIWSAIWGALSALPTGFTSLYGWCVAQLAGKVPNTRNVNGKALSSDVELDAEDVGALPSTTDGSNEYVSSDVHFTGGGGDIDLPLGRTGTLTYLPRGESTTQNNLAAWKADGGLTDSGKKPSDFQSALSDAQLANIAAVPNKADTSDLRYSLTTKTISNGAVSLDDRAINAVAVSSSLASLTINFPTATSGKARDFGLRLTVASGITTAPQIVLPQGVTCENADGEAPEIGADGAATILYFTETASGVFLVKGEVLQTITA